MAGCSNHLLPHSQPGAVTPRIGLFPCPKQVLCLLPAAGLASQEAEVPYYCHVNKAMTLYLMFIFKKPIFEP